MDGPGVEGEVMVDLRSLRRFGDLLVGPRGNIARPDVSVMVELLGYHLLDAPRRSHPTRMPGKPPDRLAGAARQDARVKPVARRIGFVDSPRPRNDLQCRRAP